MPYQEPGITARLVGKLITTTYFRDANGRLIRERHVSNLDQSEVNLVYQYDSSGAIIGFTYYPNFPSLSQYFFGKNAQGDVICIYDANNNTVARYNYDAWGACTVAYDNTAIGIANINPIRYRSYYYDTETSLYYLQSRYYDPAVGRFISPDNASYLAQTATCCRSISMRIAAIILLTAMIRMELLTYGVF